MWRKESLPLLYKYLELRPGLSVLDVGCGTGFFTRLLALGMKGQGRVIGVDRNSRLLSVARRLTAEGGFSSIVSYRKREAQSLQFENGLFDRVVCQTLLWTIERPAAAIREMIRVCKPGGLVGAVEGGFDVGTFYFPDDAKRTALERKWIVALTEGNRKLYGTDRGIGYKLPAMFMEAGLRRVRLDGYPFVWLEGDDRVPRGHKIREYKAYIESTKKRSENWREGRRVLRKGGMTADEIEELERLQLSRITRLLENPDLIERDMSMNAGIFYITTGIKAEAQ
jgi:SAM-dependent methyltransferase